MVSPQSKSRDQSFEFAFPKQVWGSFSNLKRGFGCEFVTTNLTKMSLHKISVFKYLDETVTVRVTASSISEAPVEQPAYIKIEDIRLQDHTVIDNQGSISEEPAAAAEPGKCNDKDAEDEANGEAVELRLNTLSQYESDLKDSSALEPDSILAELGKQTHEIVSVKEALEAMGNASQRNQQISHSTQNEECAEMQNPDNTDNITETDSGMNEAECGTQKAETKPTGKICPLCKRCFMSKMCLSKHIQKDHEDLSFKERLTLKKKHENMKVQCTICNNYYGNSQILRVHMEVMHTTHVQVTCPTCGVKVKNEKCLAGHMKRIHEQNERKYLCHLCPASFRVQNYLNGHLKAVHPGQPKDAFSCDICDFKSSNEKYVRLHKVRVHGDRKFQCPSCERKFAQGSNLKRHVENVHPAGKIMRYVCDTCSKTFSTAGNLKHHQSKAHKLPKVSSNSSQEQNSNAQSCKVISTVTEDVDSSTFEGYILFNYQDN